MPRTVAFHTLGCKLNFSESGELARRFGQAGYAPVAFEQGADVYVINTCSVTEQADRECRAVVHRALRHNPEAFIAVTGCFAQLKPDAVASLEGVDLVAGVSEKFNLVQRIGDGVKRRQAEVLACDIAAQTDFVSARSGARTRVFLKVQDGCDYNCSFCTIPRARGRSRSDTVENVVRNARRAAGEGAKEIVLTGVNLGDFGNETDGRRTGFIDLIRALEEVEGIARFRISSIEPNLLTGDIIAFVAGSKRFMPHFHIPLQSGSDRILKKMRRRYQADLYRDRVDKIKSSMPLAGVGADVITGFPGETEDDFRRTFEFIESLDVTYLHVFTYSERENTAAAALPGAVPLPVRKRRTAALRALSDRKRDAFAARNAGREAGVLFEAAEKGQTMMGYTENYVRVAMPYDASRVNTVCRLVLEPGPERGLMSARPTAAAYEAAGFAVQ